jgi:uncharacterized protein
MIEDIFLKNIVDIVIIVYYIFTVPFGGPVSLITQQTINAFYAEKRIAVIGASRQSRKFGYKLVEALRVRGFEVLPVNPQADRIGSLPCHRSIAEITPPVGAAILVVPPAEQAKAAEECARAGVKQLWIHDHVTKGTSSPKAIHACEVAGIEIIAGYCPFLFMPRAGFPHNLHGRIMGWMGAFPP